MQITPLSFIKRCLLGILIISLQFILYYVASSINITKTVDFLISIDQKIPFIPEFVYIYFSLYLMFIIYFAFFLQYFDKREIWTKLVPSIIMMLLIAFALFIFFPSNYPRPVIGPEMNSITHKLLIFLYKTDPPNNTMPSLHVASSMLFALIAYDKSKTMGVILTIWAILITLSTFFVKQHYITDALAGILLATFIWFVIYQRMYWIAKWRHKYEQKQKNKSL